MDTTTFTITLENSLIARLDAARGNGIFLSRAAFIRYLLDSAITEWERQNDAP